MSAIRRTLWAIFFFGACGLPTVCAATYSAPITPIEFVGSHGSYLAAGFDFGTAFRQIDSLKLDMTLADGYEGTAATTGNSSWFRVLQMVVDNGVGNPGTEWFPNASLLNSTIHVPANINSEFAFSNRLIFLDGPGEIIWPSFVFSGRGRVSFIDLSKSSFHPLPSGEVVSFSTSWLAPRGIAQARLTIEGVAVPEPCALTLMVVGAFALRTYRYVKQH